MMKINSNSVIKSTVTVIWLIVAMTLLSEVSGPFKSLLIQIGSHHWIGKGIVSMVVFVVTYLLFSKSKEPESILSGAIAVVGSAVFGALIIFGFFIWHFVSG